MQLSPDTPWRLLLSGHSNGQINMAMDQALMCCDGPPTLRLYGWDPVTLSLGYFQKEEEIPRIGPLADLPVVRRPTGGSAIVHAEEITFSIAVDQNNPWIPTRVEDSYTAIHQAVSRGLERLGVEPRMRGPVHEGAPGTFLCFQDPARADLITPEGKLVGSAQRRSRGRLLHHGSIVLRNNPWTAGAASVESAGGDFDFGRAERELAAGFAEGFAIHMAPGVPRQEELALAQEFAALPALARWKGPS